MAGSNRIKAARPIEEPYKASLLNRPFLRAAGARSIAPRFVLLLLVWWRVLAVWLQRWSTTKSLVIAAFLMLAIRPVAAPSSFVVHGSVEHQQFGKYPRTTLYRFSARSDNCKWSVRTHEEPKNVTDEVLAVGNANEAFVTQDLSNARARLPTPAPNNAVALVFSNAVPNTASAPQLGPVWLTYLSACYLKSADPGRVLVPTYLNVAGGSLVPNFDSYYQRSHWTIEESTGLPSAFHSIDDEGFLKGIAGGHLLRLEPYPPPFNKGFTNLVFQVDEFASHRGLRLPKSAHLDVFWICRTRLEQIHRYSIVADRFEDAPSSPIPDPSTFGVAFVSDGRLATTNGPIVLSYLATNRFLATGELTQLPQFRDAVYASLTHRPPIIAKNRSPLIFYCAVILITVPLIIPLLRRNARFWSQPPNQ